MKEKELYPPQVLLAALGKEYPDAWKKADFIRAMRGKTVPDWSEWCFMPFSGWVAIADKEGVTSKSVSNITEELIVKAQKLAMLGSWRPTQRIYKFDKDLIAELGETDIDEALPSEILYRLPEWCVYVATGENEGFLANLEQGNEESQGDDLCLMFFDGSETLTLCVNISNGLSIVQGMEAAISDSNELTKKHFPNITMMAPTEEHLRRMAQTRVAKAVSLLLYLCSENWKEDKGNTVTGAGLPAPKKVKTGWRLFPPDKPTVLNVGTEIGEQLRKTHAGHYGPHAAPRSHIRKAHWHGYWTGTRVVKEGVEPKPKELKLKWLPPIPVNMADDDVDE